MLLYNGELALFQEPAKGFRLLRVLAQHNPTEADELIPVDFLNGAASTVGAESQDVIEVGMPRQGILQAHSFARRAEVEQ